MSNNTFRINAFFFAPSVAKGLIAFCRIILAECLCGQLWFLTGKSNEAGVENGNHAGLRWGNPIGDNAVWFLEADESRDGVLCAIKAPLNKKIQPNGTLRPDVSPLN